MSYQGSSSRSRSEYGDSGPSRTRSPLPNTPRAAPRASGPPSRGARDAPPSSLRSLSGSTTTSTSSSFLERMKAPSSRTSLEDNYSESSRRKERPERNERYERSDRSERYGKDDRSERYGRDDRSERYGRDDRSERNGRDDRSERYGRDERRERSRARRESSVDGYSDSNRDAEQDETPGHGYDIWGRVTQVASQLTVNVSLAWQKGVTSLADGEVTPIGEESRLTKAMKAYHLAKARSPSDLPAWLFEEHERGVSSRSWARSSADDYEDRFRPDREQEREREREPPPRRGGLRDIYDSAAASSRPAARTAPVSEGSGSRATDRLRQIREAKRSAVQTSTPSPDIGLSNPPMAARRAPPAARGGLPSRPRRS